MREKGEIMYILSILSVILVTVGMLLFSGNSLSHIIYYYDIPSALLLIIITIPILLSSNLLKDFNNSFRLVMGKKKNATIPEIKRAIEGVDLVMKTLIYGSGFIALFSLVIILAQLTEVEKIGPNLAVAILSILYALAINMILLPFKSKLKVMLYEYMQD